MAEWFKAVLLKRTVLIKYRRFKSYSIRLFFNLFFMKEINPIGIRLGYTKYWNSSIVFNRFNYKLSFKIYLTLKFRFFSLIENCSYFLLTIIKELAVYYQFYKKKIILYSKYLFYFFSQIPSGLRDFTLFFSQNQNSFYFFANGYSRFSKKLYNINLLLFFFCLVKRYVISICYFTNNVGEFFVELNFVSLVNKFKIFRRKFFTYKLMFLKRTLYFRKLNLFKQKKRRYYLLNKRFASKNIYRLLTKCNINHPSVVFQKKKSFFLRLHLRRKRRFFFYYDVFFHKRKLRFQKKSFIKLKRKKKKRRKLYLIRLQRLLHRALFRRRFRTKVKFFYKKKWFFLKIALLKKLKNLRLKFYFLRERILKYTTSAWFKINFETMIVNYFKFYTTNFLFKKQNILLFKSSKLFILYTFFLKYRLEKFLSDRYNFPVYLYLKNFSKYLKINSVYRRSFFLLKRKSFIRFLLKRYFYLLENLNVFIVALSTRNVRLLSIYLGTLFQRTKKHHKVLKDFKFLILNFFTKMPIFFGIKVRVSGKFHGKSRSRTRTLYIYRNIIPLLTFRSKIMYHYRTLSTYTGIFGLHIWMFYK
jgi:hypothetical protein